MSTATDVDALRRMMPPPENGGRAVGWDGMAQSGGDVPPRLIAWAATSSADIICWDATAEDPAAWPTLVFNRGEMLFSRYECGMAKFLTHLLQGAFPECPLSDHTLWAQAAATFKQLR
ncbi:hypothetical protein [Actinomadura luteofluorescens]|uniref:hypothetical protein n=1 Tax=Actinomadura luteofluorescens TaxID=46163 RepID=UPI003D8B57D4